MKKKHPLIMLLFSMVLFPQSSYKVQFQDQVVKIEENINSFSWNKMPKSSKFKDGYFGWIKFFKTPNQAIQDDFKRQGLELIEYIPNNTYVFYFPEKTSLQYLKNKGVRAVVPIDGKYKLSSELRTSSIPDYALDGDNILVTLKFHNRINSNDAIAELKKHQIVIKQEHKGYNIVDLSIPNNCLEKFSNLSFVKWVELISPKAIKYDTRGRSLQRATNLDTQTPMGRKYTGEGIGIMVRDFGTIDSHLDFHGRLVDFSSEVLPENHGDGVAGIFAGAGNLDPKARGMAAGANIFNVDRSQTFTDASTTVLINDGRAQITNTSSGFQCRNNYTLNAVNVDKQTREFPTVLHVLAAGNENPFDCGYGAGDQWGNLGGANKTGKNIIAAGNVRFDGSIVSNSSRGPASDGRIKPDLSAMGNGQVSTDENNGYFDFGGTSAASPAIAGVAAQLYQAYNDLNGELPESALIKAIMLNTANEAGNIGPDFIYGWGIVNGLRAVKVIENENYFSGTISQGDTNNHVIAVPAGAAQVRFMVYWSDVPGAINANPALVNDLDLVVKDTTNNSLFPWVLDPTPDPIALNKPATNGPDHLNNMEQVEINNPAAGNYTLDISGFNVPMGPQDYFIVYEIISDNITVTYPNGGERFVPGESEVIHWDATNNITENYDIEYSTNNGNSWTAIATVPSSKNNYVWDVPSTLVGSALIRVSSGAFADTSDTTFSSVQEVEGFEFSKICPDGTTFVWDAVPGAESYDIYLLGEKFMEIAGNSTTTSITIPVTDPTIEIWAAIVAKNDTENWASRRTIAIKSEGGFLNCRLNNDIGITEILNDLNDLPTPCIDQAIVVSAVISNTGLVPQSNFDVSYQLSDQQEKITERVTETLMPGEQLNYNFATELSIPASGEYSLVVSVDLIDEDDQNRFNDEANFDFFATLEGTALDFEEDFEEDEILPTGWSIINEDEVITWDKIAGIIGSDGNPTTTFLLNNFSYVDGEGQEDFLVTELFDLSTVDVASLKFDLAKAQWNEILHDGLRIEVSTDCGDSFITIYEKDDLELSTLPDYDNTEFWEPLNADHWRTEEINLAPYIGETVLFRFVNITAWGNNTYIDNVNVNQEPILSVDDLNLANIIKAYPNPTRDKVYLTSSNQFVRNTSITIANSLGQIVKTLSNQELGADKSLMIDLNGYNSGIYFMTLSFEGSSTTKKIIIK